MERRISISDRAMDNIFRRKNHYYHEDRIAMRLAARFGLTFEYKLARRKGLSPVEALEDWDMLYPEDYKLFEK